MKLTAFLIEIVQAQGINPGTLPWFLEIYYKCYYDLKHNNNNCIFNKMVTVTELNETLTLNHNNQ